MNIITPYPVIIDDQDVNTHEYSNFLPSRATRRARKTARQKQRQTKKTRRVKRRRAGDGLVSRLGRGIGQISQTLSPLMQQQQFGVGAQQPVYDAPYDPSLDQFTPQADPSARSKMSRGAKIAIGVTVVAVAGLAVWYFGFRKQAKK